MNTNINIDPKYLGIPNINFSLTDKDDDREIKFSEQRINRGFDDSETWSLYSAIAQFILPRLIRFKEIKAGYPTNISKEKWDDILSKVIKAFQIITKDEIDQESPGLVSEGLDLFREYFFDLWW